MSRRKRVLLWAGLLVALAGVGFGLLARLLPSDRRISRESYNVIESSMTMQDIEKLLGGPPGNYTHGQYTGKLALSIVGSPDVQVYGKTTHTRWDWTGSQGEVRVGFDEHGQVSWKAFAPVLPTVETLLTRLRRWLRL